MSPVAALFVATVMTATLYECDDIPEDAMPSVEVGKYYAWRGTRIPYSIAHNVPNVTIKWRDAEPTTYYSVAMVDPDAPSREAPTFREIRHWLIVNVKGSDLVTGALTANGQTLSSFRNPSPPKGSGYHRYVQLVFQQPLKHEFKNVSKSITNFNVSAWAASEGLGLNACNYFETEFEDHSETGAFLE